MTADAGSRVLIADAFDERAIALLEADGFGVSYMPDIAHADLLAGVGSCEALIVRSRSKVTAGVIAAGRSLLVIARAGAGVDNIDVDEATRRGVVVMNASGGNAVSAAEHTIAMMFAIARNIPAADRSVRAMEWRRQEFTGTEISGKTLGLVGLGKVGREVAIRAAALGMRVIAFDPLVSVEAERKLGVEPAPLAGLFHRSDFISVHTPLTPETRNLLDLAAMRTCRRGVRIINCARGGIVNERDLLAALDEGIVAGAALDVFDPEPPSDPALVNHPRIVCTPHLGASTGEAQEKVSIQIARQVADFLRGRGLEGSVNADPVRSAMRKELGPLLELSEKMGRLMAGLGAGPVTAVRLETGGAVADDARRAALAALLMGFLSPMLAEPVNLVNAALLARERGLSAVVVPAGDPARSALELTAEFTTAARLRAIGGRVYGTDDIRVVNIDGYSLDVKAEGNLLIYSNADRPGMLARVSQMLARASVNIGDLSLGRMKAGEKALTVISTDETLSGEVLSEIAGIEGVSDVRAISL